MFNCVFLLFLFPPSFCSLLTWCLGSPSTCHITWMCLICVQLTPPLFLLFQQFRQVVFSCAAVRFFKKLVFGLTRVCGACGLDVLISSHCCWFALQFSPFSLVEMLLGVKSFSPKGSRFFFLFILVFNLFTQIVSSHSKHKGGNACCHSAAWILCSDKHWPLTLGRKHYGCLDQPADVQTRVHVSLSPKALLPPRQKRFRFIL